MNSKELLYDTKYRKIFLAEDENHWVIEIKDPKSTNTKSKKRGKLDHSVINSELAEHIYSYLDSFHVPNFFEKSLGKGKYLARAIDRLPIRIVIHNVAQDHLVKNFGAEEGTDLDSPVLEFFKADGNGEDLMINEYHAMAFNMADAEEFRMMGRMATKINAILKSFFLRRDLKLISFACEFGREKGRLTLMSEIDMNPCRFIDPNVKKEKDVFNHVSGDIDKAYQELKNRILS